MLLPEAKEMMVDVLAHINANGGLNQVITLIFNNSYVRTYGPDDEGLSMDEIDLEKGLFKFVELDEHMNEYISFKSVVYLEGVTMAPPGKDRKLINWRQVRP